MDNKHIAGAGLVGPIVFVASRFGYTVSTDEALQLAASAVPVGAALAHLFSAPGILPRVKAAIGPWKSAPPA
jgi:hypothetical protein